MAIKTNIKREGNQVIVAIEGSLDFETADLFRDSLEELHKQAQNHSVTFDFEKLAFVGSSGISAFIQLLREFNGRVPARPKYLNVKSEFKRLISAFDDQKTFDFLDSPAPTRVRRFDQ